jgi:hypothetical protein
MVAIIEWSIPVVLRGFQQNVWNGVHQTSGTPSNVAETALNDEDNL